MQGRKYIVNLSSEELAKLISVVSKGTYAARTIKRAQILLKLNSSAKHLYKIEELSSLLDISSKNIYRILNDYRDRGIDCIYRKKRETPPVESKVTGEVEAHLIAMACHNPPEGYCRWTLRLLSERMVQMNYIDNISHTTVGKILKKNCLKPHLVEKWCIPKEQSADFAACMEDVLEVYSRPYDGRYPVVCMDKKPYSCWLMPAKDTARRTGLSSRTVNTSAMTLAAFSFLRSLLLAIAMRRHWSTGQKRIGPGK